MVIKSELGELFIGGINNIFADLCSLFSTIVDGLALSKAFLDIPGEEDHFKLETLHDFC